MYDLNLPVLGAKSLLSSLFQGDKLYYSLYSTSRKNNMVYGLIAINEKLYDIEKQSPALDMHYFTFLAREYFLTCPIQFLMDGV